MLRLLETLKQGQTRSGLQSALRGILCSVVVSRLQQSLQGEKPDPQGSQCLGERLHGRFRGGRGSQGCITLDKVKEGSTEAGEETGPPVRGPGGLPVSGKSFSEPQLYHGLSGVKSMDNVLRGPLCTKHTVGA